MKTKVGILSLIMAAGVGESWLSILASIILIVTAMLCLGASDAN